MANDEILTDDYVAGLLSQEANDCSLKYSTMGMEGFRSDKKPANMLKPNTRFLRHIIKDTDTHNKALLAKEAAESRARLKDLERAEEMKRQKANPNSRDIRKRQMGDIHAILGGKKRQPTSDNKEAPSSSRSRDTKSREKSRRSDQDRDLVKDRHDERKHRGRLARDDDRHGKSDGKSHREERRRRSRSKDSGSEEDKRRHGHRRRDRSRSPERRRRSRSPRERKSRHRHRSPLHDTKQKSKRKVEESDDDSDPLEDLIGPAPPPRYRGRGAVGGSSGIDRRFSETYDPRTDVQMEDGEAGGNWDDAVEAFRDRQKLKQNQEERMRAAGFADEQIQRANAPEVDLTESVQWSKVGEKREWDLGKAVDTDGRLTPDEEF
ncbi:hypothetical protein AK830_g7770 [Neonectria ditissima]|uniref:Pre-mRNA-splicing factor 38B n=1 Tax=Neonectria ditissima TaxID=78410 RepID=A0A0P7BED7_9HYPO|nr:hypothetical protein AK830_g7770 [Neonectria ditissima]